MKVTQKGCRQTLRGKRYLTVLATTRLKRILLLSTREDMRYWENKRPDKPKNRYSSVLNLIGKLQRMRFKNKKI